MGGLPHDAPHGESRWPASLAVAAVVALGLLLPQRISLGPTVLVPSAIGVVLVPLTLLAPVRRPAEATAVRVASLVLLALVLAGNLAALGLLVQALLEGRPALDGRALLRSAVVIWLWNIVAFALVYWELDRGGPQRRAGADGGPPDFLFPQMTLDADQRAAFVPAGWRPRFVDYLYVSATNTTAFSPTDTLPLSRRAKLLMLAQSLVALVAIALVAARAVNVLR